MDHHDEHESGQEGLGTQTGGSEPGAQTPTPGAVTERSDENQENPVGSRNPDSDDSTTFTGAPQEGGVDEDPDFARGSTEQGEEPPESVED